MPLASVAAHANGAQNPVFVHLGGNSEEGGDAALAVDGVSCGVCHKIGEDGLGTPASFSGNFAYEAYGAGGLPRVFGPFAVDSGRVRVMRSSSGHEPVESSHIQSSALCATCHTLFTEPLVDGEHAAEPFPEQVPYLEWLRSDYRDEQSCQSCHMPVVPGEVPVTAVLGKNRPDVSRHVFLGGNFFMQRLLGRYADSLGVKAPPAELAAAADRTEEHLANAAARLSVVAAPAGDGGSVAFDVTVDNLTGHKLPTAYPSRRAWLHVVARDNRGAVVFESGGVDPNGSILGNDADRDGGAFEPHYPVITAPDQVQIYESILGDDSRRPTTGLLNAVVYLKDNRLLPRGFDPSGAPASVAVHGAATQDDDFRGGGDRTRYRLDLPGAGPWDVSVTLRYQPIGFRWARNLEPYDAAEPQRFVRYYDSMAEESSTALATARATIAASRRHFPEYGIPVVIHSGAGAPFR